MRLKALAEIYTMHSFAQLCNLIFFANICQNLPRWNIAGADRRGEGWDILQIADCSERKTVYFVFSQGKSDENKL